MLILSNLQKSMYKVTYYSFQSTSLLKKWKLYVSVNKKNLASSLENENYISL